MYTELIGCFDPFVVFSTHIKVAETRLNELRDNGDASKQALYQECCKNGSGSHPFKISSPGIGSPSLLDRVQDIPDVEGNLRRLRRQRLREPSNAVYVPPQAKANLHDDIRFPLMEKVEEFLESDQKVLLLLGDSGAGKSTFNRALEYHLWQEYKKGGTIPLHINLPSIEKPEHDMIAKQLRRVDVTEPQIRELKFHRKFILICDGYDESQQSHNLYTNNRLNETGEWNAKMVISCRSENLGVDYRDRFQPGDGNRRSGASWFQEAIIAPFSVDQVQDYIDQYVKVSRPEWDASDYNRALNMIPSLKELVKNPFLMSLSLEVLPRMVDSRTNLSANQITRVTLYDLFIEHWLERGKKRLGEQNLNPRARSAFESLTNEGFTRSGVNYLKKLSAAIYKEQRGQPIVTYSRLTDGSTWKAEFFSNEGEKRLLRETCPLVKTLVQNINQYQFIHRSILEYGVALAVFDPQDWKERPAPESALTRRGSTNSFSSSVRREEEPTAIQQEPDLESPLGWRVFVNEPSVLQFLEERAQQEPLFKQQLLKYIEYSKGNKKWREAAANAITILVRAGVQFNNADLRGIQIPLADLSGGMFDSAQLEGADLRHVILRGAWLRQANLSKALMKGVRFGEPQFLEQEERVTLSVYSPDGKSIAIVLNSPMINTVNVYSTSNWEGRYSLGGHHGEIFSVVYSLNNRQIASCSADCTIRLWDAKTGSCQKELKKHCGPVKCITYSPQGMQLASASDDMTVRLWNVADGSCSHTLTGHTDYVVSVAYSLHLDQIASGSWDKTIRLWNTTSGECLHVLDKHTNWVWKVVYSHQGDTIASASIDTTVRLWDATTGDCRRVLEHNTFVLLVAYAPNKDQVASTDSDNNIRVWDVDTGTCLHSLCEHSGYITTITYSKQGDLIASASHDKTVRLWDTMTGTCRDTLTGHSDSVSSVMFSPKTDYIVSSGADMTVRLWDVGSRLSSHTLGGHDRSVLKIARPSKEKGLATCSKDVAVRIWDMETGECRHTFGQSVSSAVYSPCGGQIATHSEDNNVQLWNVGKGVCIHTLADHSRKVNDIAFSSQGDYLASASKDTTVRLWSVSTGMCLFSMEGHTDEVLRVVFSPDGSQLASGSVDKTIRLWDLRDGVCSKTLQGHDQSIDNIVFSLGGDRILSAGINCEVRVWDVRTGACRHTLSGHSGRVYFIQCSPDGNQVASASGDSTVKLWDVESGADLQTLSGHRNQVKVVAYSRQGDKIASASDDMSVRLWHVASGQCRAVIQDFQGRVHCVEWVQSSGVDCLVTGCRDGSVRMWEVTEGDGLYRVCLRWSSMNDVLAVTGSIMHGVQGLSQLDKQLLKQRGAVGDLISPRPAAGKEVSGIPSVISKHKTASSGVVEEQIHTSGVLVGQLVQRAKQTKDPLVQGLLEAVVKDTYGSR